jgi:predicted transcriptional regulator
MKKKSPSLEEQILRASKEIVVKFIETGRVSPSGFPDTFKSIYQTVHATVTPVEEASQEGETE